MKKSILLAMVSVVLAAGWAGCSKEEGGAPQDNKAVIYLDLPGITRTESGETPNHDATMMDAYVFLAKNGGSFIVSKKLSDDELTALKANEPITFNDLDDVPTEFFLVGNVESSIPLNPLPADANALRAIAVTDASQKNDGYTTENVILYGEGSLTGSENVYSGKITVAPIGSLLEMGKITGINNGTESKITGFTVDGIFVNNFFERRQLGSDQGTLITYDDEDEHKFDDPDDISNESGYKGLLHLSDWIERAATEDAPNWVVSAQHATALKPVFGYQVLAGNIPHIVIRLSGVTSEDGSYNNDPYFVTIRKFQVEGDNGLEDLTAFQGGKIYRISDLTFIEDDISDIPEPPTNSASVTLEILDWTEENLYPKN